MTAFLWSQTGQLVTREVVRDPPPPAVELNVQARVRVTMSPLETVKRVTRRRFSRFGEGLILTRDNEWVRSQGVDYVEDVNSPIQT